MTMGAKGGPGQIIRWITRGWMEVAEEYDVLTTLSNNIARNGGAHCPQPANIFAYTFMQSGNKRYSVER